MLSNFRFFLFLGVILFAASSNAGVIDSKLFNGDESAEKKINIGIETSDSSRIVWDKNNYVYDWSYRMSSDKLEDTEIMVVSKDFKYVVGAYKKSTLFGSSEGLNIYEVKFKESNFLNLIRTINEDNLYSFRGGLDLSSDNSLIAFATDDNRIKIVKFSSGMLIESISLGVPNSFKFSPDGNSLLICSDFPREHTSRLILWNMNEKKEKISFELKKCYDTFFSHDGHFIYANDWDMSSSTFKVWNLIDGKLVGKSTSTNHSTQIYDLSPDNQYVLIAVDNEVVQLKELSSGKVKGVFAVDNGVAFAKFSPDGQSIIVGDTNTSIDVWSVASNKHLAKLNVNAYYDGPYFSPSGFYALLQGKGVVGLMALPGVEKSFDLVKKVIRSQMNYLARQKHLPHEVLEKRKLLENSQPLVKNIMKDEFESTSQFKLRAAKLKREYKEQVARYNEEVAKVEVRIKELLARRQILSKEQRNTIIHDAFLSVFGRPVLSNIRYDADTQMFFSDLRSSNPVASNFKRTLAFGPVPNNEAKAFKQNLSKVSPEVIFKLDDDGAIHWQEAKIEVKGLEYALAPTDVYFKPIQMQTKLAAAKIEDVGLRGLQIAGDAANRINVNFSVDPELARLQKKLYEQRKRKAQSDAKRKEVTRLETELRRMKSGSNSDTVMNNKTKRLLASLPSAKQKNRYAVAVIIGNHGYSHWHKDLPDVSYARNDAALIKAYITRTLGYRDANVIYINDATQANFISTFGTRNNPRGKLYNLVKSGRSDVFVYYSGHGVPGLRDGKGYLLPIDADPSTPELNGYALDTLYANLAKLPARSITVALDACFSGTSDGGAIIKNASPALLRITDQRSLIPNAIILTAASNKEVASWDRSVHLGLFTRYMIEGVSGKADHDHDGSVSLIELKHYLDEEVPYQARRHYGRDQHPQVNGPNNTVMAVLN